MMNANSHRKNSYLKILLHVIFWGIFFFVPLILMSRYSDEFFKPYKSFLVRSVVMVIIFYINYFWLIDHYLFRKKFAAYFLINLVLVGSFITIQEILIKKLIHRDRPRWERIVESPPESRHPLSEDDAKREPGSNEPSPPQHLEFRPDNKPFLSFRVVIDNLMVILIVGMSVALKATFRWYRDSLKYEKIKSVQLETDLKNLRDQLNPHFLFNTLNNIYSLTENDPQKAQYAIHRLSSLLRYVLYVSEQDFSPLKKELEFTCNYIDLLSLRVSNDTDLKINIDPALFPTGDIASLLFITIIENAFKYGGANWKENFIEIDITSPSEGSVRCEVRNSIRENGNTEELKTGIGLSNLRKRLDLIYPGKYLFRTSTRDGIYTALLEVKIN